MTKELVQAAQRLADLLKQENAALTRMDFPAAVALVPAKEAALADLTKQPKIIKLPSPLVALGQLLGGLATQNQILLERAIAVQTRIVRIVARAGAPKPSVTRYGGHGGIARPPRATALALSTRA
jgi:hypothetical protein